MVLHTRGKSMISVLAKLVKVSLFIDDLPEDCLII